MTTTTMTTLRRELDECCCTVAPTTAADKVPITGLQHHIAALDLLTRNVGYTEYPRSGILKTRKVTLNTGGINDDDTEDAADDKAEHIHSVL
ncbi:unnamed protein product [Gongylonema pulchrum]|uniref:Uncharacterized protein n=1 Tax=Gongylonema pulchrum TaxID=637853 RepID=A0A183F0B9_9BILA|nr:unnamed protein product [Gongylonema pulchrum]